MKTKLKLDILAQILSDRKEGLMIKGIISAKSSEYVSALSYVSICTEMTAFGFY
jgi:hypothetical protein